MVEPIPARPVRRVFNFEADLHAGELRQAGKRLRLTGQPFSHRGLSKSPLLDEEVRSQCFHCWAHRMAGRSRAMV